MAVRQRTGSIMPNVIHEGYMQKRGTGRLGRKFQKRWFVLTRSTLRYFKNEAAFRELQAPKGTIDLDSMIAISDSSDAESLEFQLQTFGRTYDIRALSSVDKLQWTSMIRETLRSRSPTNVSPMAGPHRATIAGGAPPMLVVGADTDADVAPSASACDARRGTVVTSSAVESRPHAGSIGESTATWTSETSETAQTATPADSMVVPPPPSLGSLAQKLELGPETLDEVSAEMQGIFDSSNDD